MLQVSFGKCFYHSNKTILEKKHQIVRYCCDEPDNVGVLIEDYGRIFQRWVRKATEELNRLFYGNLKGKNVEKHTQ